ncbi:MAG TPA: sensor domain-containing phosphodiesterase [Candidatus Limnocylindria bacterium]|nr:sensor domain-containing phosphodiesterase [Candidatus Limnocylindria bacterium]
MNGWSTQQLTEFLAAIGATGSRAAALRLAVERVAEAVEAEVAAVMVDGRVAAQVGFASTGVPGSSLRRIAAGDDPVELPGLGRCRSAAGRLDGEGDAWLVVARAGDDAFNSEDRALLRGMARILTLALRNLRLLTDERRTRRTSQRQARETRQRQRLLEALARVQRLIVDRAPQQQILDRLVSDVGRLVGDPVVGLRLLEPDGTLRVVAAHGIDPSTFRVVVGGTPGSGAGGLALAEDRLVVIEDYPRHPMATPTLVERGLQAAAAAPIRADGRPIGSLVVASTLRGRQYGDTELEALTAFAELASLAITDAERTEHMLHSALHDALTGLPNRSLFSDRLAQRLMPTRRRRSPAAVLFIDIDDLKRVNDTLGHLAGDMALVEVGRRLTSSIRVGDTVARMAGDEFTVLMDGVEDEQDALAAADRLAAVLRRPLQVADRSLTLTASIGVRLAQAGQDRTDDVLRGADLAMYEAKARGGGGVSLFHPELDQRAARRLELESDLRTALDGGQFRVLYQPIVSLCDGSLRGVEALVRWDRGTLGLVSPVEFIPLAEETGLIVELGAWVLGEACRAAAELTPAARGDVALSVNLSARQLLEPGLEATVAAALAASGLAPERLTLEITESVLLSDAATTLERLEALRRLGVRVAIDDFGTGYSSLSYLRRLPLDAVKIDRSFVEQVTLDPRQAALVRGIVELCHALSLDTVAEGVETAEQARALVGLGCDLAQGYHFGRPTGIGEIAARHVLRPNPVKAGRTTGGLIVGPDDHPDPTPLAL